MHGGGKFQSLGFANDYMDPTQSEIGKWLTGFFGLAFLPSEVTMWKTVLWKTLYRCIKQQEMF